MKKQKPQPNIPLNVGTKIWLTPKGGSGSLHCTTIFVPQKRRLNADFYIFCHGKEKGKQRLYIIDNDFIGNYIFFTLENQAESYVLNSGYKNFGDNISKDLPIEDQIYVEKIPGVAIELHVAIPKDETAGFMPTNPTEQTEQKEDNNAATEPEFTVNKGE